MQTRKQFIVVSAASAGLFFVLRLFRQRSPKQPKTVKLLTQDGRLVEVDASKLPGKKQKLKDADIYNWIVKRSFDKKNPD